MTTDSGQSQEITPRELPSSSAGGPGGELLAGFTSDQPGLAALVASGGKVLFERYLGAADLEHGAPITAASRFQIASLSKQSTAFAVLQLAWAGKLGLDTDIHDYLPELAGCGATSVHSTARDLLKWSRELLLPTVFESELISAMRQMGRLRDGQVLTYGFGLVTTLSRGGTVAVKHEVDVDVERLRPQGADRVVPPRRVRQVQDQVWPGDQFISSRSFPEKRRRRIRGVTGTAVSRRNRHAGCGGPRGIDNLVHAARTFGKVVGMASRR